MFFCVCRKSSNRQPGQAGALGKVAIVYKSHLEARKDREKDWEDCQLNKRRSLELAVPADIEPHNTHTHVLARSLTQGAKGVRRHILLLAVKSVECLRDCTVTGVYV